MAVKVRFLRGIAPYRKGDIATVAEHLARVFEQLGHVEIIDDSKAVTKKGRRTTAMKSREVVKKDA